MKRKERLLPVVFILMLIGGLFSCNENEDIDVPKQPDTIKTEYGEVIISADYVPIEWNKSANQVLSIEVPNEKEAVITMALENKKLASEIQAGSIITVDVDTAIYLRKVTSATVDGTKVTAVTTQGSLEDVFSGSEFELCLGEEPEGDLYSCDMDEDIVFEEDEEEEDEFYAYEDDEDNDAVMNAPWRRKSAAVVTPKPTVRKLERSTKKLPRFYPTEIRGYDENGEWKHNLFATTRDDDTPSTINISIPASLDLHPDDDGSGFSGGVKGNLTFSTSLGFRMTTNYSDGEFSSTYRKGNVVIEPVFFFTPKIVYSLQLYFNYTASSSGSKSPKFKEHLLKHFAGPKAVFAIGPVPMMVAADCDFYAQPEVSFTAEVDFTIGGQLCTDSDYELGLRYEQKKQKFSRVFNKPKWDNTFQKPTFALSGTLEGKINVYPKFSLKLYDIIGPYLFFKPYIGASASAGVNTSTGDTWKLKAFAGVNVGCGIGADVLGYELVKKDFVEKKIGKEFTLAEAPAGLSTDSGEGIKVGKMNDIEIEVQNYVLTKNVVNTWMPCNVLFYSDDDAKEICDEYSTSSSDLHSRVIASTKNGKAKIQWVPSSMKSTLTAAIYETNGEMNDFIVFRPDNTPEGAKGVDMGTGLLWANMNVGAKDDNESGDLVGWADVSGKHKQQSFDASYGNYVEDVDECMKYYGGTSPKKNIAKTQYDYATTHWGGQWRMATQKEWLKLIRTCTWTWDQDNERYVVTSPAGKTIYFPAAGYELGGGEDTYWSGMEKVTGEYWTSDLDRKNSNNAWYVGMYRQVTKVKAEVGKVPRYYRQSIRAVRPN